MDVPVFVVNSVAAIFAVIAAIIAVVVYRKSAKLQKKAINYGLFETRLRIISYFEHYFYLDNAAHNTAKEENWERLDTLQGNKTSWEIEAFKMLFSSKAVKQYEAVEQLFMRKDEIASKIANIYLQCRTGRPSDEEDIKSDRAEFADELLYYEHEFRKDPHSESIRSRLMQIAASGFMPQGEENYFELLIAEVETNEQKENALNQFIIQLKAEVKQSIL